MFSLYFYIPGVQSLHLQQFPFVILPHHLSSSWLKHIALSPLPTSSGLLLFHQRLLSSINTLKPLPPRLHPYLFLLNTTSCTLASAVALLDLPLPTDLRLPFDSLATNHTHRARPPVSRQRPILLAGELMTDSRIRRDAIKNPTNTASPASSLSPSNVFAAPPPGSSTFKNRGVVVRIEDSGAKEKLGTIFCPASRRWGVAREGGLCGSRMGVAEEAELRVVFCGAIPLFFSIFLWLLVTITPHPLTPSSYLSLPLDQHFAPDVF